MKAQEGHSEEHLWEWSWTSRREKVGSEAEGDGPDRRRAVRAQERGQAPGSSLTVVATGPSEVIEPAALNGSPIERRAADGSPKHVPCEGRKEVGRFPPARASASHMTDEAALSRVE